MHQSLCSIIASLAITSFLIGCSSESGTALEANKSLVRQFIAETDAQNFDAYDQLLADDVIAHFPNGIDMDRQTVEENERTFAIAFPDASRSIDQLYTHGDRVFLRETLSGTHIGPFGDIQSTGRPIKVTANIIYRIADAKIAESWVEADLGTFMSQLAAAPDQSNADYQAIQAQTFAWAEDSDAGDLDAYFNYITEDFIWLGDDSGPGYSGHDEVREFLEPWFNFFVFSIENVESNGVVLSADGVNAIHRYSGTAAIQSKETGEVTKFNRRYVDFWRKEEDGIWRCSRHLFLVVD